MGRAKEVLDRLKKFDERKGPTDYAGIKPKGWLNAYDRGGIESALESVAKRISKFNRGHGEMNMDDFWHLRGIINDLSGIFAYGIGKDVDPFEDVLKELKKAEKELSKLSEDIDENKMAAISALKDEFGDKWVDAVVTDAKPSKHGKGTNLTVKTSVKGLPPIIQGDMLKTSKELKRGDKVKIKLYISASGVLIDEVK